MIARLLRHMLGLPPIEPEELNGNGSNGEVKNGGTRGGR
jgi:hypothetical protein